MAITASPDATIEQQLREMNDALLVSADRQNEMAGKAHEAEAAMHESEEQYRTLFDLGPVAIYSCDAAGVIQTFNRRAAELWGREPAPGRYRRAVLWLVQDAPSRRHFHAPRAVSDGRGSQRKNNGDA